MTFVKVRMQETATLYDELFVRIPDNITDSVDIEKYILNHEDVLIANAECTEQVPEGDVSYLDCKIIGEDECEYCNVFDFEKQEEEE